MEIDRARRQAGSSCFVYFPVSSGFCVGWFGMTEESVKVREKKVGKWMVGGEGMFVTE